MILAYGRDPYFSGWPDTLQLNYANPILRMRLMGLGILLLGVPALAAPLLTEEGAALLLALVRMLPSNSASLCQLA
jgi:hypothetical protein